MPTTIRLARAGAKNQPFYRIVVADSRRPRDGKFIEKIGTYNPLLPKARTDRVVIQEERLKHWLSTGAVPSERVVWLMDFAGIKSDVKQVKDVKERHARIVKLKEAEIKARKQAEAEQEAKEAAERKTAAETKAAEEVAKAAAEKAEQSEKEAQAEQPAENASAVEEKQ